ncbi:MAG: aminoacyl-tRNA hydrolase [Waddliaceae bacterium]
MQEKEKQRVFVGLGNPGKRYEITRHNIGYLVIRRFADKHRILLKREKRFLADCGRGVIRDVSVHLVLPATYMNESGQAVRRYVDYFKPMLAEILVISDDLDLPFGQLRLRTQGTAGGHKGLKSVEEHLGTIDYPRLRIGIGRSGRNGKTIKDYVLDRFDREEYALLPSVIERGVRALEQLLAETIANVMNVVNVKKQKEINDG